MTKMLPNKILTMTKQEIEHRNFMEYYDDIKELEELVHTHKLRHILETTIVDYETSKASQEDLIDSFRKIEFDWARASETLNLLQDSKWDKKLYREILEKIFPIVRKRNEEEQQNKDTDEPTSTGLHEVKSNQQQSTINGIQSEVNKTEEG